jgi:SM-20-related protein
MMLNLEALAHAPAHSDPFDFLVARNVLAPEFIATVGADFPRVPGTGSFPAASLPAGAAFRTLVADLASAEFAAAVGARFGCDLAGLSRLITVRGRSGGQDGFVHTDAEWKVVTALLYLNPHWDDGTGRLRLLRSRDVDDVAVEVPPDWGTIIAFRRSDRSFHGHKPFYGERRVIQIAWAADAAHAEREERRHRRSAALKLALHRLLPKSRA